ncbi:glycosyltransferase family 1 protein [Caloramator sp. E03]|uniref:glycosyltransferase n=1 Tax=Caloramator sp. E03 TaxID=2576307 RepID=UPI0011104B85|nr:glycosyltransferase [Caloramator sp. E03]QCX34371.1 glycosyltransferase family 1 protein [Caloramator sp. E03]
MKKIIFADFKEYDDNTNKLGNHHYADLFANNGYEVLWISNPWNFLIYFKDKNVYRKRKSLSLIDRHKLKENIYGFAPYSIFLYGNYPFFNKEKIGLNLHKFIKPNLKETLNKIDFLNVDILWISNPKQYYLKNIVNYKKLIYRIADDFAEFSSFPKSIKSIEEKLINESDLNLAVSKNIIDRKKYLKKDIKYLPNGVDIKNFIRDYYIYPFEFKNNKRPKIIYVGAISEWFDIDLIVYAAEKLKEYDFYIIGQPQIDLLSLKKQNIFILGKRNYYEIPNYLYFSDAAIIPFKVNNMTNSVSPIKLYEYMSVGLNVVSTNFKEMQYINSPAYIANNYDEFCEYIVQAIENKEKNRERNIQFAKENTWEKRFEEIKKYI